MKSHLHAGPRRVQMNGEQETLSSGDTRKGPGNYRGSRAEPAESEAKGGVLFTDVASTLTSQEEFEAGSWSPTGRPVLRLALRKPPPLGPLPRAALPRGNPDRSQINPGTKSVTRRGQPPCAPHAPERAAIRALPLRRPLRVGFSRRCGRTGPTRSSLFRALKFHRSPL